jgi:hypothetical protein
VDTAGVRLVINQQRMSSYPKQIVIEEPLWGFMRHCEVYCSGACCGVEAFEVHRSLLLRKVADMHLAGTDGTTAFRTARRQMAELKRRVASEEIQTVNDEAPFWTSAGNKLPEFWLPLEQVGDWLVKWEAAFTEASQYGGLDGGNAEPGAAPSGSPAPQQHKSKATEGPPLVS